LASTETNGIPVGPEGLDPSPAPSAAAGADSSLARPKPPTAARRWLAPLLGLAALAGEDEGVHRHERFPFLRAKMALGPYRPAVTRLSTSAGFQ
jgi:hypothetical protein